MNKLEMLLLPFSKESREYVKNLNIDITNASGLRFIVDTLKNLRKFSFENLKDIPKEYFLLYPYLRIILSLIDDRELRNDIFFFYYRELYKRVKSNEQKFLDFLEIDYDLAGEYYIIDYTLYLYAEPIKEKNKLVNTPLKEGRVYIDDVAEFIARLVATKVFEGLPLDTNGISPQFKTATKNLKKHIESNKIKYETNNIDLNFDAFPDCMKKVLDELLKGGVPSHIERYYLATFMFAIGASYSEVHSVFSKAGDYKEDIVKYQLEKIQSYAPPTCETLKSQGIGCKDCDNLNSPMQFYYRKVKGNARENS